MIVYKNIFTKDFSMLKMNLGYVKEVFDKKTKITEVIESNLREEIENLKTELSTTKDIRQNEIDELDATYFVLPDNLKIDSTDLEDISNGVELIKMIKSNNYDVDEYGRNGFFISEKKKKNNFNKLLEIPEYKKKFDILTKGKANEIQRIDKELIVKRNELEQIKRKSLSELINRDNKEEIFNNKVDENQVDDKNDKYLYIKESPYFDLLKYIISNGYIDENTYFDYMSYFYLMVFHKMIRFLKKYY